MIQIEIGDFNFEKLIVALPLIVALTKKNNQWLRIIV